MGTYATFKHLFPLSAGYSRCVSIRWGRERRRGKEGEERCRETRTRSMELYVTFEANLFTLEII